MLFEKNTDAEIELVAANLTNFFKAIVNFIAKIFAFLGIDEKDVLPQPEAEG